MTDRPVTLISGGQTGADRAALDVARALGLPHGGAVPKGRAAEDGPIPDRYGNLVETETADPAERTRRNVLQSDATLLLTHGEPRGGSALTRDFARAQGRPFLHLDLSTTSPRDAQRRLAAWLQATPCRALNVAGPRGSEDPDIYRATFALLRAVLGAAGPHRPG